MFLSRVTEMFPNEKQRELINQMFYIRRKCWNKLVEVYNPIIVEKLEKKEKKVLPSKTDLEHFIKALDLPLVHNRVYVGCVNDYLQAWEMCFKIPQRRKPKFHSVFQQPRVNLTSLNLDIPTNLFYLSAPRHWKKKEKEVKLAENFSNFQGKIPCYSITKRNNHFYVSFTFKLEKKDVIESQENQIGLDWGIMNFFTTSNNTTLDLPNSIIVQTERIKNLQRLLSKKQRNSKNYNRLKEKLNKAWLRLTNQRKDFIEKLTFQLLKENNFIAIEDLDIQNMIFSSNYKTRRRNIYKNCFGIFRTRLIQKSERFCNSKIILIDKYFPSSQICSQCGKRHSEMKDVEKKIFVCDTCGRVLSRDLNAAINILKQGLFETTRSEVTDLNS